ncbi:MAG: pyridoxamine 5'-phosphate oxidase family protein [Duodenibacillus sp.]|nr:pyridoxamine 5'-phosphate oxidase family protein [Duodenibacillus sp.]
MPRLNRRTVLIGLAAAAAAPSALAAGTEFKKYPLQFSDRAMTDPKEIEYTLRKAKVGSFSFVDGDEPYVIPWTYGFDFKDGKSTLYMHCARNEKGRKRQILKKNNKVAFDIHCDLASYTSDTNPGTSGWSFRSITGVGRMHKLEGKEKIYGLQRVFLNQSGHVPHTINETAANMVDVMRLDVEIYCGKKANKQECPLPPIS